MMRGMSTLKDAPASANGGSAEGTHLVEGREAPFPGLPDESASPDRGHVYDAPIDVRARSPADLAACVGVLRLVRVSDGYPAFWPANPERWIAPDWEHLAWVATDAQRAICGHIALHRADGHAASQLWTEATGRGPDSLAAVARLFVAPSGRRRGVGKALLDVATETAYA